MPPFAWSRDPMVVIKEFEERYKSDWAGPCFLFAISSAESLHYLHDIDLAYETCYVSVGNHRADVVDVAHARWATSSCISVLDLCAAGLGHAFCSNLSGYELDLGCFDAKRTANWETNNADKQRLDWQKEIPPSALQWVRNVLDDVDYGEIKKLRNALIHSRLNRHFRMSLGGPPQRLKLEGKSKQWEVPQIVQVARDVATTHVSKFLEVLFALSVTKL